MATTHTNVEAVFDDAKDTHVSNYVLYGNANKLYVDSKFATEVTHDEAFDACLKGVLVYDATNGYSTVTSFKDSAGTLSVVVGETTYTVAPEA